MGRAWTVQNKNQPSIFTQKLVKTPTGSFKQVSEEF